MAGFETIVRPVVFPNIRPQPTPSLPPADDPTQGMCVISGSNGTLVTFTDSYSISWSESRQIESKRRYDDARIYQQDDDGNVNRDNFVDVQVPTKIWMKDGGQDPGGPSVPVDFVVAPLPQTLDVISYYTAQQETDNIEIRNRNLIKKNPAG